MNLPLVLRLALNDFKARYAGSKLGIIWAYTSPMVMVLIYWFVYTVAFGGTSIDGVPYFLWLICGIVPWYFFSNSVTGATTCYTDYRFLVRKVQFSSSCLPLVRVITALCIHLVLLAVVMIIIALNNFLFIGQLWVIFWTVSGFLFVLGIGKILSIWNVFLRDVSYGVQTIMQIGFWITPVFWNEASLHESLRWLSSLNPVAVLVKGYRQALLYGSLPDIREVVYFLSVTIIAYGAGVLITRKCQPTLADRI